MTINLARTLPRFPIFPLVVVVAMAANLSANEKLFPLPEALKPNVEFWKQIYGKYSEQDVVIHDAEDLSIVYTVVNRDSLFKGINVSHRLQWKKIGLISKEYKSILLRLARHKNLKLEALSGKELEVAKLFGANLNAKRLRRASKHVRTQSGVKERFKQGLIRSGLYLEAMHEIFREAGLPVELTVLPHVESSFNYKAYSKFGAAGIWQFTRSTGRMYMKINYSVDERLDPIIATKSAAKHLKRNFAALRNWPLAITAYNHGLAGMKRARQRHGADITKIVRSYKSRSFGFASRNFYSEFLAALHVSTNYREYFGELEMSKARQFIVFKTPDYIEVKPFLAKLGLSFDQFADYNPALRRPVLRSQRRIPKNFEIRLPYDQNLNIDELYVQLAPEHKHSGQVVPEWHKVRSGETLSRIAGRYRVSMRDLMAVNNIRNAHRIYVGQNLQIPGSGKQVVVRTVASKEPEQETRLADASVPKRGDQATILDVPRSMQRVSEPPAPAENAVSNALATSHTVVDKADQEVTYVRAKSRINSTTPDVSNTTMEPVQVAEFKNEIESVDELMAIALPDYYVELTREMDVRIVKAPQFEPLHESFRDIDPPENGQVEVEPDETLGHFADWLGVSTQKLRNINGLAFGSAIRIGRRIWLTFERVTPEAFHSRRVEYHQGIEEDFYSNFRVEGQISYRVQRGDSIWILCNRKYEMPYWLLKKYNLQKNLLSMRVGDEIIIPLIESSESPETRN